ncbi:MAG TPA: formyltetrahydrofolate deformylase [Verrucomicrobiales bacterium]|nr:formyltetrahydrofolate deformylase [Verrucomicrobiales bacterium]
MILKFACPDQRGLVARVTSFLAEHGANILDMAQFTDQLAGWFFLRIHFDASRLDLAPEDLHDRFAGLARGLAAEWRLRPAARLMPTVILVTRERHCLQDLLARCASGELPISIRAVVSNHEQLQPVVERAGCPFVFLPVDPAARPASFEPYRTVFEECAAELVVLARFMQILPPALCRDYAGRIINIHHSFLPAFAGANPYRQAFRRGVKIIGATSHYVTEDLDAGPIIEQEVLRVEHYHTPEDLVRLGRDCERIALSRAVRYHSAGRVLIHGNKTVVFRD